MPRLSLSSGQIMGTQRQAASSNQITLRRHSASYLAVVLDLDLEADQKVQYLT